MAPMSTTRMRLERLVDERERVSEKIEDSLKLAEDEQRDLNELEGKQITAYRTRVAELEDEIGGLTGDLERAQKVRDVSALIRGDTPRPARDLVVSEGQPVYRTFAQYARDALIVRYPMLAAQAADHQNITEVVEQATDRLQRVQNTLTTDVAGLVPPTHMAQILDIINKSRPVCSSGRQVNLDRGKLTYPRITGRPESLKQTTEKTEAGTAKMTVALDQIIADTYLGGGDLSWQTISWSTPDALQLWFDLAAEAYAHSTEAAACSEIGTAGGGTITTPLGTAGTESFGQWRTAIIAGISSIYTGTAGRARTNTLYLSAQRFFQLAALGSDQVLQVSSVGSLDVSTMTGTYAGLRVVGSYGFSTAAIAVVGDSDAFLVGESAGSPVEMRAVEPAIGGMEVGVIGAFKSKVFDSTRFVHLS